jgi:ubiquinone/menaquinone biosynthesis C-methylase UbiE
VTPGWEDRAENWTKWARRPKFDAYWAYRECFLDEILPTPGEATLEIGCGEGRVARDMASRGHTVTAIDASPTLVASAAEMDPVSTYQVARAELLPFSDATFDIVVAYNSLMDVQDMPMAVEEAGRVLVQGGRMAICVTHPTCDAGTFSDDSENASFIIKETYRGARPFSAVVERDGLKMNFDGRAYDLEFYTRAFEHAGLLIERVREPAPDLSAGVQQPGLERGRRIPYFLMLRLVKPDVGSRGRA